MLATDHLALTLGIVEPAIWVARTDRLAGQTIDYLIAHGKDFEAAACLFAHLAETRAVREKAELTDNVWNHAVEDFGRYPDRLHVQRVRALFPRIEP